VRSAQVARFGHAAPVLHLVKVDDRLDRLLLAQEEAPADSLRSSYHLEILVLCLARRMEYVGDPANAAAHAQASMRASP
jgi:hypothetical protein